MQPISSSILIHDLLIFFIFFFDSYVWAGYKLTTHFYFLFSHLLFTLVFSRFIALYLLLQHDDARTFVPRPMRIIPVLWEVDRATRVNSLANLHSFRSPPRRAGSRAARRWRDTDQVTDPAHPTCARVLPAHPRRRIGTRHGLAFDAMRCDAVSVACGVGRPAGAGASLSLRRSPLWSGPAAGAGPRLQSYAVVAVPRRQWRMCACFAPGSGGCDAMREGLAAGGGRAPQIGRCVARFGTRSSIGVSRTHRNGID